MHVVDPATVAANRHYPSISLLIPLAGASPWPDRLRSLAREATARLRAEFGAVDPVIARNLETGVATAAPPAGARSLAVYVNADGSQQAGMSVEVRERVVIDDTFATRDLVHDELRSPRYWVLALNLDAPRVLRGHGARLRPETLPLPETAEHPSARNRPGRDRSDVMDAYRNRRFRAVDMALDSLLAADRDPLVAVGAEPTISRYLDRTRHRARISGVVRRAPDQHLDALAASVAPALAEVITEQHALAFAALDRAVGAGTARTGVAQVWRSAQHERGALLLVEHGFEHPARIEPDGFLDLGVEATAPDVVDDLVDDTIELVLARAGRVEIVPDGSLASHQRIALVPARSRRR